MKKDIRIVFFGSTSDSVLVLDSIATANIREYHLTLSAIVTQSPKPVGRSQTVTPTPVEQWAKAHGIPVLTFAPQAEKPWLFQNDTQVTDALEPLKADLIISASFGLKIPWQAIKKCPYGGLNIHPSILPRWRGADPVPWAIMTGDHQIGVSIATLSEKFDQGKILAQEKIPIGPKDTSDPLRTKLFTLGAELLITMLPDYLSGGMKEVPQKAPTSAYARKLKREDGFVSWEALQKAMIDGTDAQIVDRKFRALIPWPGLWTEITIKSRQKTEPKRLKILTIHLDNGKLVLDDVQLEGKKPVSMKQLLEGYPALNLRAHPKSQVSEAT